MPVGPAFGISITEANVLKTEALADGPRKGMRMWRRDDPGLDLEEFEQVPQINGPLRYARKAGQYAFQQTPQLPERSGQEGQVSDGQAAIDGFHDDHHIGGIITTAAQ